MASIMRLHLGSLPFKSAVTIIDIKILQPVHIDHNLSFFLDLLLDFIRFSLVKYSPSSFYTCKVMVGFMPKT